ncbi:hypothetical protein L228DRAFT_4475 [Xylona heveae TC161]|uniref:RING-type domain-containing protein n=1 Tax=Xylona heveae (strain CBS 132557 / TC161) TaxID=1328760 RepID=A0A165JD40_XYLHT|nr:hypothetical protein L228DRAFT_4475 [Xylona heveae TC161]KZF26076.1 hypothetical protein L228DRAFT_4475 [Xylona heveae TC161]
MDPVIDLWYLFPHQKYPDEYRFLFKDPVTADQAEYRNKFLVVLRILRFLRPEQPQLALVPDPDGRNLDLPEFQLTFDWFRSWLSLLHRGSLLPRLQERTQDILDLRGKLDAIAIFARRLCENERERLPKGYDILLVNEDNRIFVELFKELIVQLRKTLGWVQISEIPSEYDSWRPLLQLCEAEFYFEQKMQRTHVEDCVIWKRIKLSEFSRQDYALEVIQSINEAERSSFWIRQLRQHGFKRPWKQLFLVRDDGEGEIRPLITDLLVQWCERETVNRALDVRFKREIHLSGVDCAGACLEPLLPGELIMELHCGHFGHTECLFGYWDSDEKVSFPCPFCRHDPGPILKKMILDVPGSNINREYHRTERQLDHDAYEDFINILNVDMRYVNTQYIFPPELRQRALRHQARLDTEEEETRERRASAAAAGALWATDPSTTEGRRFRLYPMEQDNDPPEAEEGFWFDDAYTWLEGNFDEWIRSTDHESWSSGSGPTQDARPHGMPAHLWRVWREYRQTVERDDDIFIFLFFFLSKRFDGELDDVTIEDVPGNLRDWWRQWDNPLQTIYDLFERDVYIPDTRDEFEQRYGPRWVAPQYTESPSDDESSAVSTERSSAYDPNDPDVEMSSDSGDQLLPIDLSDEEMQDVEAQEEEEREEQEQLSQQQWRPFFNAFFKSGYQPVNPLFLQELRALTTSEDDGSSADFANEVAEFADDAKPLVTSAVSAQRRRNARRSRRSGDEHVHFASPIVDNDGLPGRNLSPSSVSDSGSSSSKRGFTKSRGNFWDRTGYLQYGWTIEGILPTRVR